MDLGLCLESQGISENIVMRQVCYYLVTRGKVNLWTMIAMTMLCFN